MITATLTQTFRHPREDFQLAVALTARPGELLALSGPSGAGKTSVLRMLAGLLPAAHSRIFFRGVSWENVPPERRNIGFVFQDYALFPHMTVRENLAFAAKGNDAWLETLLTTFELEALSAQYPRQLSGGQQQRVALARALVQCPDVLLLDEPLSALESALRVRLGNFLRRTIEEQQITALMVSHDPAEIVRLADRVLCLASGQVVACGDPAVILLPDETALGLPAEIIRREADWLVVRVGQARFRVPGRGLPGRPGETIRLPLGPGHDAG